MSTVNRLAEAEERREARTERGNSQVALMPTHIPIYIVQEPSCLFFLLPFSVGRVLDCWMHSCTHGVRRGRRRTNDCPYGLCAVMAPDERLSRLEISRSPCAISSIQCLDHRPPLQAPTGLHCSPVLACPVPSCPVQSTLPPSLPPSEGHVRQVRQVRWGEAGRLLLHRPSLPIIAHHLLLKHQHAMPPPPSRPRIDAHTCSTDTHALHLPVNRVTGLFPRKPAEIDYTTAVCPTFRLAPAPPLSVRRVGVDEGPGNEVHDAHPPLSPPPTLD